MKRSENVLNIFFSTISLVVKALVHIESTCTCVCVLIFPLLSSVPKVTLKVNSESMCAVRFIATAYIEVIA